ncbi:MAG: AraC family transcriptional regulator [Chitinophagaceae bacterium]|nr:MAG: AraC family transcriptional regulator [Chitinophagaceae bacterium]
MKKGILAIAVLLIAVIGAVYVFIPSRLIISDAGIVNCSLPAAQRFLFEEKNWRGWINPDSLNRSGYNYRVTNTTFTKTDIVIKSDNQEYITTLRLLPFNTDSTGIEWGDTLYTGNNPFTRLGQYRKAIALKKQMDAVMGYMTSFLNDKSKIYSANIFRTQLKDEPLLSKRVFMKHYPTADDAHKLIDEVRKNIAVQGDSAVGSPMKYSSAIDSNNFELMVGVPTSRLLKSNNGFIAKGLVGGNLIATEIRGGEWTISEAWKNIRQYKADYKLSSPAIPFESMITDRRKETDTTKWITRIYYPLRD